jgi:hypothetical protein
MIVYISCAVFWVQLRVAMPISHLEDTQRAIHKCYEYLHENSTWVVLHFKFPNNNVGIQFGISQNLNGSWRSLFNHVPYCGVRTNSFLEPGYGFQTTSVSFKTDWNWPQLDMKIVRENSPDCSIVRVSPHDRKWLIPVLIKANNKCELECTPAGIKYF